MRLPFPDDDEIILASQRKVYFAQNLRFVVQQKGWTLAEAAEKFGVKYQWLRRAASQGIAWTHHANPSVERIANHFACKPNLLWCGNGSFREHYFKSYRTDRTVPEAQLASVLAHYTGRAKPPLLDNALKIIRHYYDATKGGREPDDDQVAWLVEVVEFLGGRGPIVDAMIQAISETARLCGEELPFDRVEAAAEHYFDQIGRQSGFPDAEDEDAL